MTKKQTPTKTKSTKPSLEETIEAPPEPRAPKKLDTAIRAKAHSLVQVAIADLWVFVEKPNKDQFDLEVLELLAGFEIGEPPTLLEDALGGPLLGALDHAMRSKLRIKPASMPRTPTSTVNSATGFASHATEQSKPYDADLLAERLLKATTGRKK